MNAQELDRLARKRAGAKMGWYLHALVYVAVNLILFLMAAHSPRAWTAYPALGWGLGLLIHGVLVFARFSPWMEKLVAQERRQLARSQPADDPW